MGKNQNHPISKRDRSKSAEGSPAHDDDALISETDARKILGGVSHMFFRRRIQSDVAFPKLVMLGRRRFYWRSQILRWAASPAAATPVSRQRKDAGETMEEAAR